MSGITMQGPFEPSSLSSGVKRRCGGQLQKRSQCPNGAKYVITDVDGEFYFFCGVHLKPTLDSVTRMNNPIVYQAKFGDGSVTVVSSVPSVSVSSVSVSSVSSVVPVVPDFSDIENKREIKQLQQQLQELQELHRQQQEVILVMGKQIEFLLTIKVEGEKKKNQEE